MRGCRLAAYLFRQNDFRDHKCGRLSPLTGARHLRDGARTVRKAVAVNPHMISGRNAVWEMPLRGEHLRATDAAGDLPVHDRHARVREQRAYGARVRLRSRGGTATHMPNAS